MLGNVREWTCSVYDKDYGGGESRCDKGENAQRVLRGGSWYDSPSGTRSADRYWDFQADRNDSLGFRVFQDVR